MTEIQTSSQLLNGELLKRMALAFGLVLLYLAVWSLPLFPIVLLFGDTNPSLTLISILVIMILLIAVFLPYLNFIARYVFHFQGDSKSTSLEQLRARLLEVNSIDAPVVVEENEDNDRTLVITWRYTDAKWYEIIGQKELQQQYELHVTFRPDTQEVLLTDVQKSKGKSVGPFDISLWYNFSKGIIFVYERRALYGLKENFTVGEVYNYEFSPSEIKIPVMNTILTHGWDVRFSIW